MNFEKSIPFDLGFNKYIQSFSYNIDYVYSEINRLVNLKVKALQFQNLYKEIINEIDLYINFYIGCLLWACYIKQFENKEISNNPVLGQEISDEEGLYTLTYLRNYLPKFEKDVKYYLHKDIKLDSRYYDLIDLYEKFLKMNKHFTQTKTSSDLVLPFELINPDYDKILTTIQGVVETGDFSPLREYLDVILNSVV